MPFAPSKYQEDIFKWVKTGRGNAVIDAKAGSGKTTTIVEALSFIPSTKKTIFLAFNKEIATTIKGKVPSYIDSLTLNSLGYRAWTKFVGKRVDVDGNKLNEIGRALKTSFGYIGSDATGEALVYQKALYQTVNLAKKAKVVGLVPAAVKEAKGLVEDNIKNWEDLAERFNIDFSDLNVDFDEVVGVARDILRRSIRNKMVVDYDDQFYMPLIYDMTWPKYDFVLVDEAQDVSDIQRVILSKLLTSTSRLIAVGDMNQSIYGFRGANPNSLEMIVEEFSAQILPLSISYRCSKSVVRLAQTIVPTIEPSDTAPEGEVKTLEEFGAETFKADDMIVCRNMAPLLKLAYNLLSQKRHCIVRGRDIGQGLIVLIDKLKAKDIPDLLLKIKDWCKNETARAIAKDPDANLNNIEDKAASLTVLAESSENQTIQTLKQELTALFQIGEKEDKKDVVILSSIHRSKGLEAERVFILNRELMPSRYAKKAWELKQEQNLEYVAITRAKHSLFFISIGMN